MLIRQLQKNFKIEIQLNLQKTVNLREVLQVHHHLVCRTVIIRSNLQAIFN